MWKGGQAWSSWATNCTTPRSSSGTPLYQRTSVLEALLVSAAQTELKSGRYGPGYHFKFQLHLYLLDGLKSGVMIAGTLDVAEFAKVCEVYVLIANSFAKRH